MGIPKFYGYLRKKNYNGVMQKGLPGIHSSLFLDCNGIFHKTAQIVYSYGEYKSEARSRFIRMVPREQLEAEHFQMISAELLKIISQVNPTDLLIIAVDGVAPQAKIAQQRSRRFRAVLGRMEEPIFDPNSITPGTDFMRRLDLFLQRWIDLNKLILPGNFIYSSHMVPGEGEHKIMDFIREGYATGKAAHVFYGMDADLIMLSLLCNLDNVYLMREDIRDVLSISNLRYNIMEEMGLSSSILDFVLIVYLIGNDFLPHAPALDNLDESIDRMIDIYKSVKLPLVNNEAEIIWSNFQKFLEQLAAAEPEMMDAESKKNVTYPSRMVTAATTTRVLNTEISVTYKAVIETRTEKVFHFDKFRDSWYSNEFYPKGGDLTLMTKLLGNQPFGPTTERIVEMIRQYLIGVAWSWNYYNFGVKSINLDYWYGYYHAPLFVDLVLVLKSYLPDINTYISDYKRVEGQLPLNPVHQLLSVLPLASKALLPPEIHHLAAADSPIGDYYPVSFQVELDGKMAEWQGVAILPFVDPDRIRAVVDQNVIFGPERALLFTQGNDVEILRDTDIGQLLDGKRAYLQFQKQVAESRGRGGRGRGFGGGFGRGFGEGRGYQGQGYQRGGYQGGGYRGGQGGEYRGRGGYQRGRGRGTTGGFYRGRGGISPVPQAGPTIYGPGPQRGYPVPGIPNNIQPYLNQGPGYPLTQPITRTHIPRGTAKRGAYGTITATGRVNNPAVITPAPIKQSWNQQENLL